MEEREAWLARTFVELSDTLVADFDLLELYAKLVERCTALLEGCEVALALADPAGTLCLMASSSDAAHLVELVELQAAEGPGLDTYRDAVPVLNRELRAETARWPRFARSALEAGYAVVHALPMRLREQTLGALIVFDRALRPLAPLEAGLTQALADVAAIALLQERAKHHESELAAQLQRALNSRIAVEQAKGILAERLGIDVDGAFSLLRAYARQTARRIDAVAHDAVERTLAPEALLAAAPPTARPR